MKQANIYNKLVRYYNRSRQKLHSLALEGKNLRKQDILKRRIVRLFKTLTGFQHALKLGMATAALSAGILLFQPDASQAQAITFKGPSFGLTNIGYSSAPAFADLDADGDLDLMAGEDDGNFFYFRNTGTAANPVYDAAAINPFGLTNIGKGSVPAFADLDADGDLDLMAGEYSGSFFYFKNTGTVATPVFAAAVTDPFGLTYINIFSSPTFADLDADGDLDMMAGEGDGSLIYFRNTGTAANPVYDAAAINPFGLTGLLADIYSSAPAFADLDADGDLDLMAGHTWGSFVYFQNTGTAANPVYATTVTDPFGLTYTSFFSSPAFADLDADGDLDMMAGEYYGNFFYFKNIGTAANPVYTEVTNPFGLTDIGLHPSPVFADLDADGDLDMMSGEYLGSFYYFRNTGTTHDPVYAAAVINSFGLTDIGKGSSPAFADLDADGDLDLMSGEFNGSFIYFPNTGTAANPVYAASVTNPFGLTDIGFRSTPAFADLDSDGDWDMISGANSGGFFYFRNTGTAATPAYAAEVTNPFGLTDIVTDSSPAFADLDEDGDLDLMSGDQNISFFYFQNTGTAANPVYAAEVINPFGLTDIGYNSSPAFADLDADGDLDIMSGESAGNFFYFENTTPCNGLTVFTDADGDSYGDAANSLFAADCIVPSGYVMDSTDCNDANAGVHPAATEFTNGIDENCNGIIDDVFCSIPINLSAGKITASSVKLKWDAVTGAQKYKLCYKVAGTNDWIIKYPVGHSKTIEGLLPNTEYKWEVKTYCKVDSPHIVSAWSAKQSFTTAPLRIGDESFQQISFQIYPNPAEDHATIQFTIPQASHVSIKVYDVSGKEIATLLDEDMEQGDHSLLFNTNQFSKGVYLVKMISDFGIENEKLIVQ